MLKPSAKKKLHVLSAVLIVTAAVLTLVFPDNPITGGLENFTGTRFSGVLDRYDAVKEGELEVHVIDVGQAECILIRTDDANVIIDTGSNESESMLSAYLSACRIKDFDYLICTHPHSDHIGGADFVLRNYDVENLLMTDVMSDEICFKLLLEEIGRSDVNVKIPYAGENFTVGDMEFTVLGPLKEYKDENDMSLAIKLTFGETSFLFTGDAGSKAEKDLLEHYGAEVLDCDFYSIAHHGANTASSAEFLAAVSPYIAASSSEKDNEYGHPRGEVLNRLKKVGCNTVLRTDLDGSVIIKSDGKVLTDMTK